MTTSRRTRTVLLGTAGGILLATLAFLFVKSNAADHKAEAQALALLHELAQLNQRWDADALRLANTLTVVVPPLPDRVPILTRIFQEIEHGPGRDVLTLNAASLRAGMEEKQATYQTLQQRHARSLQTAEIFRERLGAFGAEVAAVRVREPGAAPQAAIALAHVERMRAALNITDI